MESVGNARSVTHETAGHREFAPRVDGRYLAAGGKSHELVDVVAEQRSDTDLKRLDPILYECCESVLYLQSVARIHDQEAQPESVGDRLQLFCLGPARLDG
jgi:hypothetical protein